MYAAIGEPNNRHRKPVAIGRAVERMMILDAVLAEPGLRWLGTERDKQRHFFMSLRDRLGPNEYPRAVFGKAPEETIRYFPDKLPIGVEPDGRRRTRTVCQRYTDAVRIWLELPDDVVEQIAEKGTDLSRAALEALAIDAYRMNRLSDHQLCELLEIPSRDELDGFLKRHGVPLDYTIEDFDREGAISARLWQKRQEELAAERGRDQRPE